MKTIALNLPTFGFVVATRAMLGVGIGILVADRLPATRRRATGATLAAIGALATIPAVISVRRGLRKSLATSSVRQDERLIGATRLPRRGDDEYV